MKYHVAIDAGATRTRAGLYDEAGDLIRGAEAGGANPLEIGIHAAGNVLVRTVKDLMQGDETPGLILAAVAGAGKGTLAHQLAETICRSTGADSVTVCNDIAPMLRANLGDRSGVFVVSGTGSSVLAQSEDGSIHQIGGHGAILGDGGSGYYIGLEALRACANARDGLTEPTELLDAVFGATRCSEIDELVFWSAQATKREVAALAEVVCDCAENADVIAQEIIREQADSLVMQTRAARQKAGLATDMRPLVHGGMFDSRTFAMAFSDALSKLGESRFEFSSLSGHSAVAKVFRDPIPGAATVKRDGLSDELPATERMLPSEKPIDTMTALEITDWMTESDKTLYAVMHAARSSIATAIESAAHSISRGGRIIYLGAGTSGRLGVLDASECPPTFGVTANQVVGLIAGGDHALRNSIEDAEDSLDQAARDLTELSPPVSEIDFVVGITASGTTPYVHGALRFARGVGATTCLMSCNPASCDWAQQQIVLETGPEVLPGSTRLKAGSVTKLALNQITTGAMARCGHIYDGYMVGVRSVNAKLHERTVRITSELLDVSKQEAQRNLDAAAGDIKVAVLMVRLDIPKEDAEGRLDKTGGHLRDALDL